MLKFVIFFDSMPNHLTIIVGLADMSEGEKMHPIAEEAERVQSTMSRWMPIVSSPRRCASC